MTVECNQADKHCIVIYRLYPMVAKPFLYYLDPENDIKDSIAHCFAGVALIDDIVTVAIFDELLLLTLLFAV